MSFVAGAIVGVVIGTFIGDEEKIRIQKILKKQLGKLRKDYGYPIREGATKVKDFFKAHLH